MSYDVLNNALKTMELGDEIFCTNDTFQRIRHRLKAFWKTHRHRFEIDAEYGGKTIRRVQ